MHNQIKKLLPSATGASGFVIALFLDVRGFSSWFSESSEAAVYLRRMYARVLDDFFPDADFFKPTGDGLLVILGYGQDTLAARVQVALERSLRLVDVFPALTAADPMINFPVPQRVGVGLARGAVTCLSSGRKVLDYSGRPLNLAARLMDLSRPMGVTFDDSFIAGLTLPDDLLARFQAEEVYIKGLAEDEPMTVHITRDWSEVPETHRRPMNKTEWEVEKPKWTVAQLKTMAPRYLYRLGATPLAYERVSVTASIPIMKAGQPVPNLVTFYGLHDARAYDDSGRPTVSLQLDDVLEEAKKRRLKQSQPLTFEIKYPKA